MMSRLGLLDRLALGILAGTATLTAALYTKLPDRVPIRFDFYGEPSAWADRPIGVGLLPVVALLSWALIRFGHSLLQRRERGRLERSPTAATGLIIVALLSGIQVVVLWVAIREPVSAGMPLGIVLSFFALTIGLVLPRIRRNPFFGVRTPWTLTSDENWARTHRLAGRLFTVTGLAALVTTLLGNFGLGLALIVAAALISCVYSYAISRRLPPRF